MSTIPCCVLVDGDPDYLAMLQLQLPRVCPDFKIFGFCTGLAALEFLERTAVNFVLTDFQMPVLNGVQLSAAIRSINPTIPVVIMSGGEIGNEAMDSGASALLWKGALMTELRPTLERLGIHTAPPGLGWMAESREADALDVVIAKDVHRFQPS
jgi:two-component system C4-dicarboxylate transport response regulator DctD